jgi:hypothetical protein
MSEHSEQCALFEFVARFCDRLPELALLYAIPNGGKRDKTTAARLKSEGVRAGVLDACLPVARQGFHGYYLEMKAGKNRLTPAQHLWADALSRQGYAVSVHYDWTDAARSLVLYLGCNPSDFGLDERAAKAAVLGEL